MNKTATWVLTDTRQFGFITFTCSECGRKVSVAEDFDANGHYDMEKITKELMEDYPYCHCGAKMNKDKLIRAKIAQMRKTHELAKNSWAVKEKNYWKVEEVVSEVD